MLHTFEKMDAINPTFELIQKTMKDNLIHDCLGKEKKGERLRKEERLLNISVLYCWTSFEIL